jgi:hypothetical protein
VSNQSEVLAAENVLLSETCRDLKRQHLMIIALTMVNVLAEREPP